MKRLSAGRPLVRRGPEPWLVPAREAVLPPVKKARQSVEVPVWDPGVERFDRLRVGSGALPSPAPRKHCFRCLDAGEGLTFAHCTGNTAKVLLLPS